MAPEQTNEKIVNWNGQKLEDGTMSGERVFKMRPRVEKNLEKWDLKIVKPPAILSQR